MAARAGEVVQRAVGVAEPGVGAGLFLQRADVGGDDERGGVVPQRVRAGFAEAVQRARLACSLTGLAEELEGAFEVSGGPAAAGAQGASAVQRPGLADAVAETAVEGQRLVEVAGRQGVPAQAHLQVAEGGQRPRLAGAVADLPEQRQRPLDVVARGAVLAQSCLGFAEVGQRPGLPRRVPGPPVHGQRPRVEVRGQPVASQVGLDDAQVVQRAGFACPVADPPEQGHGPLEVLAGRTVAVQFRAGHGEAGQGVGLCAHVTAVVGGVAGMTEDGQRVGEVPPAEVAEDGLGQPGGVRGPAVGGGAGGDRDERGAFGVEPRSCAGRVGEVRAGTAGGGDPRAAVHLLRIEGVHRGGGGGQVEVEQAGQRGATVTGRVLVGGLAEGVRAHQVVQRVPAGEVLVQQVFSAQVVENQVDVGQARLGHRGDRAGVEVVAGMRRRQPQQPSRVRR